MHGGEGRTGSLEGEGRLLGNKKVLSGRRGIKGEYDQNISIYKIVRKIKNSKIELKKCCRTRDGKIIITGQGWAVLHLGHVDNTHCSSHFKRNERWFILDAF